MSNRNLTIPEVTQEKIIDTLTLAKALKEQTLELYRSVLSLAEEMKEEHFATQDAVRLELSNTQKTVEDLLEVAVGTLWDNAINQMPEKPAGAAEYRKAEELTAQQRDKILLAIREAGERA